MSRKREQRREAPAGQLRAAAPLRPPRYLWRGAPEPRQLDPGGGGGVRGSGRGQWEGRRGPAPANGRLRGRAAVWGRGSARTRRRERPRPLPARRGRPRSPPRSAVTAEMRGLARKLARGAAPVAAVPGGSRPAPRPPLLGTAPAPSGSARVRSLRFKKPEIAHKVLPDVPSKALSECSSENREGGVGARRAAPPVALPLGRHRELVPGAAVPRAWPRPGTGCFPAPPNLSPL